MATWQDVLKSYNVDQKTAVDFLMANVNNPGAIFKVALDNGITVQHLSDISGYSSNTIRNYFAASNLDSTWLDEVKVLSNLKLGNVDKLVDFNNHTGALSTSTLRDLVKVSLEDPGDYESFFRSEYLYQEADGLYTPDETGVPHLGNIQSTPENLESIFYGTLINILNVLDGEEFNELLNLPDPPLGNVDDYIAILSEAMKDSPAVPYSDSFLQENTVNYAANLIDNHWNPNPTSIGILDGSPFLELVIA